MCTTAVWELLRIVGATFVHCQQELPGGFPCHVPGHTGVSGTVTQLRVVDLQVPPTGQDPQPGASLSWEAIQEFTEGF